MTQIEEAMMSAYLICDVDIKDRTKLKEYLRLSEPTLATFDGVFHAQAGATETLEGNWNPKTIIIAEFPSMQKAKDWYHSKAYAKALEVRPEAMERNMILTAGLYHN